MPESSGRTEPQAPPGGGVSQHAPFELIAGHIQARAPDDPTVMQRLKSLGHKPPFSVVTRSEWFGRAWTALRLSRCVRESGRFWFAEMRGASGVRRYRLRETGAVTMIRHRSVDVWTLAEIFLLGLYEPVPAAREWLAGLGRPARVIDLGGNVGIFGAYWLNADDGAKVVAYEPDPANLPIHRAVVEANNADWQLVEKAAGVADGVFHFQPQQSTGSHVTDVAGADTIEVSVVDVMDRLQDFDLLKMDIEGGEWPILADPRFGSTPLVVLEYHPLGCPEDDPGALVDRLLTESGYEIHPVYRSDDGHGMLWGVKPQR